MNPNQPLISPEELQCLLGIAPASPQAATCGLHGGAALPQTCQPAGPAAQRVRRSRASRYLAAVFSMTSRGRRGAGGVLSQGLPPT